MKNGIPFNIWDDFWNDDCVPAGEIQQTHGYIEDGGEIPKAEKRKMAKVVFDFLKTLDLTGVDVTLEDDEIDFKHLTHERLDALMKELEASGLKYKRKPFYFYSES